jgi:hypothetical protein
MKTILIHALLVVSAAFAPGVRDAIEFPERTCEVAQTAAVPLFWHLWDKLLTHELARGIRQAPSADAEMEWQGALSNDAFVCVSIPEFPIRRTIGRSCSSCLATRLLAAGSKL